MIVTRGLSRTILGNETFPNCNGVQFAVAHVLLLSFLSPLQVTGVKLVLAKLNGAVFSMFSILQMNFPVSLNGRLFIVQMFLRMYIFCH